MPTAIRCTALTETYPGKPPVEAVRGIDLSIEEGECFGVLGPNGASKTTTIEILEGLLEPTCGEVAVLGMNWRDHGALIRQRIGISLQETRLSDKLTVTETVRLFRSFYRRGLSSAEALARVGLQDKSRTWVKHFVGWSASALVPCRRAGRGSRAVVSGIGKCQAPLNGRAHSGVTA